MNQEEQREQLIKEELGKRDAIYNESVLREDEELKKTHLKKEFTFSTTEKRRLLQQESILAFAHQAVEDIINLSVLARVGITPGKDVRILYDASIGRFTIWTTKPSLVKETKPTEQKD